MHSCPACGQACTCGGDTDDLLFDDPPSARPCQCSCESDEWEPYDDEDDDVDERDDEPHARCVDCSEQADFTSSDGEPRCWLCEFANDPPGNLPF